MFIGVDLTGPSIGIGLVSPNGDMSFPSYFPVDQELDSETVIIDLIFSIKTIAETVPIELFNDALYAIGIAINGKLDEDNYKVVECANECLENIALAERLQRNFEIPVVVRSKDFALDYSKDKLASVANEQAKGIAAAGLLSTLNEEVREYFMDK